MKTKSEALYIEVKDASKGGERYYKDYLPQGIVSMGIPWSRGWQFISNWFHELRPKEFRKDAYERIQVGLLEEGDQLFPVISTNEIPGFMFKDVRPAAIANLALADSENGALEMPIPAHTVCTQEIKGRDNYGTSWKKLFHADSGPEDIMGGNDILLKAPEDAQVQFGEHHEPLPWRVIVCERVDRWFDLDSDQPYDERHYVLWAPTVDQLYDALQKEDPGKYDALKNFAEFSDLVRWRHAYSILKRGSQNKPTGTRVFQDAEAAVGSARHGRREAFETWRVFPEAAAGYHISDVPPRYFMFPSDFPSRSEHGR